MGKIVSIIIPVYNVEKYISRCLDSVIKQSYEDIEIIIVNDGSTDSSGEIIEEYLKIDKRINYIKKDNGGLSSARNTGMLNSNGEYYYFLDSDDYISATAIETLLTIAVNKNSDITIGNMITVTDKLEETKKPLFVIEHLDVYKEDSSTNRFEYFIGRAYGINACNRLYNKQFINKIDISFEKNSKIYAEDMLFNLKCYVNSPIVALSNEYTYYYFENSNSITRSSKPRLTERFICLMKNFSEYAYKNKPGININDIMCYIFLIAIANSCLDIAENKNRWFKLMRHEIKIYLDYAKENDFYRLIYIKEVNKNEFKIFNSIFILFSKCKCITIATLLQVIRFKINFRRI